MAKVGPVIEKIDYHYLQVPTHMWGYTDLSNADMTQAFVDVQSIVNPKRVIEIGMFAGHSTILMLNLFKDLQQLYSYDPIDVSAVNAKQISKYYNNWEFTQSGLKGHEYKHEKEPIDLIFVDGGHKTPDVITDLKSCAKIKPKYILFDNVEHAGVRMALDHYKLFNESYNPQFWFYVNRHKGQIKPGIFMLIDAEHINYKEKDLV